MKNLKNLGKSLNKIEQKNINGGFGSLRLPVNCVGSFCQVDGAGNITVIGAFSCILANGYCCVNNQLVSGDCGQTL